MEGEEYSETFSKVLERQNLQNEAISELYTNDNKSKYSGNLMDIFKFAKICTQETTSKAATTEFLTKIPNRKKISYEQFNLWMVKTSLNEIIKSINSQGNDSLTAKFYKHFSNELPPVL